MAQDEAVAAAITLLDAGGVAFQDEWRRDYDLVPHFVKLTFGAGYKIKVPSQRAECCAEVDLFGFGQVQGKSPKIASLAFANIILRGNARGSYDFLVCPYDSPRLRMGDGANLKLSLSGALLWGIDGPDWLTGDAAFEVGGGYAWKFGLPDFNLMDSGWGAYARAYYERDSFWSGKRRWQVRVTIGQSIFVD